MSTDHPAHIDRYTVHEVLGQGSSAVVLRAWDPQLGRPVAIKLAHPAAQGHGLTATEARLTSRLHHPGIVPVHEVGALPDGRAFFVMKWVRGDALRARLDAASDWPLARRLEVFGRICEAVAHAHAEGVAHCDLKPENVVIGAFGEVVVMDWGLGRELDGDGCPSEPLGPAWGTPGYLPPERGTPREDLRLGDLWSLGIVLYELLTLSHPWPGSTALSLELRPRRERPQAPHLRSPEVPPELSALCQRLLATAPGDRPPSVEAVLVDLRDILDGRERRQRAQAELESGRTAWERHEELLVEQGAILARVEALRTALPPWTPREDKAELLGLEDRLEAFEVELAQAYGDAVAGAERALSHDPDHPGARRFLAGLHFRAFEAAERTGDAAAKALGERRVRAFDHEGHYVRRLWGSGRLSLQTTPPGARVRCRRVVQQGLVWPTEPALDLGTTPLVAHPLDQGSYLLTIEAPGFQPATYPVHITRNRHWEGGVVPLLPEGRVDPSWCYVPAGPFAAGGDPGLRTQLPAAFEALPGFLMARHLVTMAEWCAFINALHERDPDEAFERCPAQGEGQKAPGRYWARPGPGGSYEVPLVDRDGDPWDPRWPVFSISWDDARAYCAWRSERDGVAVRLPAEREWEKAGRGVDGRIFPWGSRFDATLCRMAKSRPPPALPSPVGTLATDRSVYGVEDLAGLVREWCGDLGMDGQARMRVVRGGAYAGSERVCRLANRYPFEPHVVHTYIGFRLARDLPALE